MRLCVIGDPVGHSLSPLLHRQMLARAGLTGSYETVTVTPDTLPEFLAAARAGAWDGCNVTMPLKQAILPLLDELDPAAAACGADGLIIEVHNDPPHALCDGAQSITPAQFDTLMGRLTALAPCVGREL